MYTACYLFQKHVFSVVFYWNIYKRFCITLQVLVVANPANTNALILKEFAPSIPEKNISCLTRLDHNRALEQISERLGVQVSEVKNVIIWGNHSSTQYPDVNHATVTTPAGDKSVRELVADDAWYVTNNVNYGSSFLRLCVYWNIAANFHTQGWMESSLQLFNNVVLQLSRLESFQVHYQLLVLLVTILEIGFLELLRLVGILFDF